MGSTELLWRRSGLLKLLLGLLDEIYSNFERPKRSPTPSGEFY